jgi:hypothetical protein
MSINPHWYSTIFGFLMMGGQGLAALAFTIIVSTFLFRHEPMSGLLKPHHFHDLGKLMFAFVMLCLLQLLCIMTFAQPGGNPY